MNILVDARPLCIRSPGGVTRVTRQLLDALFAIDQDNAYILGTTGAYRPTLPWSDDVRHRHLHRTLPNKFVSSLSATKLVSFEHWFRSIKSDLLFLPNLGHVGIPQLPFVLLVHDLTFLIEPRWYSWRSRIWHQIVHAKKLITQAKLVLTISEHTKQDLMDHLQIPAERIRVLPFHPKPCGIPQALPTELEGTRFLLSLGGRDRRKNATASIQAWNALRQEPRFKDVHLVVLGGKPATSSTVDEPYLHFFDHPTDDLMATLYKHAAVFLYPSWSEGFGIPLHEAARFGTPCVGASGSVLEETAPEGTLLIPPEKPHLLVEAIRLQLEAPQRTDFRARAPAGSSCVDELLHAFALAAL